MGLTRNFYSSKNWESFNQPVTRKKSCRIPETGTRQPFICLSHGPRLPEREPGPMTRGDYFAFFTALSAATYPDTSAQVFIIAGSGCAPFAPPTVLPAP